MSCRGVDNDMLSGVMSLGIKVLMWLQCAGLCCSRQLAVPDKASCGRLKPAPQPSPDRLARPELGSRVQVRVLEHGLGYRVYW